MKKNENRISVIIDAAINEFLEKGYEKASMESIAKRSELSKGGLYHHFKSKTDILFAVNLKFMEPVSEMIGKIETVPSVNIGLEQFIAEYLRYWNNHISELSLYFFTINISYQNKQIMDYYIETAGQMFDYLELCYTTGQKNKIFVTTDSRSTAVALMSCLDGYLGYMLIDQTLSLEKITERIQQVFVTNLLIQK